MGNVLFMDIAKGKVTSSTKRLEPVQGSDGNYGVTYRSGDRSVYTQELMQIDGTYGSSDPYVFWFSPEGVYRQWNGKYLTSSVPVKLKEPVMNFNDIDRDLEQRAKTAYDALKEGKQVNDKLEVTK